MTALQENQMIEAPGIGARIEASFCGRAFAPHRHDTYAIGITLSGVQTFDYRGAVRHSLPGGMIVLHPDESHDGRAGTDEAFTYRTLNLDPSVLQSILGGFCLPFIESGLSKDTRLRQAITPLLEDYEHSLDALEYQDGLFDLVMALVAISSPAKPICKHNYQAAQTARDYIIENISETVSLDELERITGRERWALSRDFRALYGVSPYRYLIMRRLEKAKQLLSGGCAIADAAIASWFSDQSHFTRHFRKTYGLTPSAWRTIVLSP